MPFLRVYYLLKGKKVAHDQVFISIFFEFLRVLKRLFKKMLLIVIRHLTDLADRGNYDFDIIPVLRTPSIEKTLDKIDK